VTRVRANAPSREERIFLARERARTCSHLRAVAPVELELSIERTSGSAVLTSLPVSSHHEESLYARRWRAEGRGRRESEEESEESERDERRERSPMRVSPANARGREREREGGGRRVAGEVAEGMGGRRYAPG